MALDILPPSVASFRLHPVKPRHASIFGFALLTVSCALASFALACATPFAAFAVIAAATLPLRPALLVVTGAWLVNQSIGFGALHYPIHASTIAWGFTIGAAALAATALSAAVLRSLAVEHSVVDRTCGHLRNRPSNQPVRPSSRGFDLKEEARWRTDIEALVFPIRDHAGYVCGTPWSISAWIRRREPALPISRSSKPHSGLPPASRSRANASRLTQISI